LDLRIDKIKKIFIYDSENESYTDITKKRVIYYYGKQRSFFMFPTKKEKRRQRYKKEDEESKAIRIMHLQRKMF
jgi:hypothetical protein